MTTLFPCSVTCGACGRISKQTTIGSTNTFGGGPDLDLRPSEMMRSTMHAWVQECPGCGLCAADLAELTRDARTLADDPDFAEWLAKSTSIELASRFARAALLAERNADDAVAARAWLCAAWDCDDRGHADAAVQCRERTVKRMIAVVDSSTAVEPHLVFVDVLRRAGRFDDAARECDRIVLQGDANLERIRAFQRQLIEARDAAAHRVAEAIPASPRNAEGLCDGNASQPTPRRSSPASAAANALEDAARTRYRLIEQAPRACDHCGAIGGAADFRLSIGATAAVICRRCGWPQTIE